jgi:TPR repeat protein/tetratricopeptide (TPR) repeat protein
MGASDAAGASGKGADSGARRPVNPHVAGNPVGGSDAFVGREDVLRAVVEPLGQRSNQGIVLYGQRRIGKTSILQQLVATLPERTGHRPVWFDLQDKAAHSLDEVLADLAIAIAGALGLPEPKPEGGVEAWFRDAWLPPVLASMPEGVSLVLLFDEFDVLADVQAKQAASALFPYLRRLLEKNAPRLRAVFVIGRNIDDLENVAHALFKGLPTYQVSLLARKDAEAVIRLGEANGSIRWNAEAVEAAWGLTHGHPLLLQALCSQVWVRVNEETTARAVGAADVEDAVEPTLGGTRGAFEWLWKGLPPGKRIVAAALAQAGAKVISEEELERILKENGVRVIIRELREAPRMLIEWDLLEAPSKGRYQFRVELLRRWIERFKPLDRVQEDLDRIEPAAEALYKAAEALYRAGSLDAAMARLQETLGLNPNHVRASELLADIRISHREWAEARTVLERLYEMQPAVARARLVEVLLAEAPLEQDESEQLARYERVRNIEKSNATATTRARQIWKARGDRARAKGEVEAALEAYKAGELTQEEAEVTAVIRTKAVAKELAAIRRMESEGAYPEALTRIRLLLERYPEEESDVLVHQVRIQNASHIAEAYKLGQEAMRSGDKEHAIQLLGKVIGMRPNHEAALRLLHILVTNTDAAALEKENRATKAARVMAEAELARARTAIGVAKTRLVEMVDSLHQEQTARALAESRLLEISLQQSAEAPAPRPKHEEAITEATHSSHGSPDEGSLDKAPPDEASPDAPSPAPVVAASPELPASTEIQEPLTTRSLGPAPRWGIKLTLGAALAASVVCGLALRSRTVENTCPPGDRSLTEREQSCRSSKAEGCFELALTYAIGSEVEKDESYAALLLGRSCDRGHLAACANLGMMHERGRGVRQDPAAGVMLYKKACVGGYVPGCYNLASAKERGVGTVKDESQAAALHRFSCKHGHMPACLALGGMLDRGEEHPDGKLAIDLYESACDRDYLPACRHLGLRDDNGMPSSLDSPAGRYMKRACDGGHMPGCSDLGVLYERHEDGESHTLATSLYRRACDGGDMSGCYRLGDMYEHGKGVEKDQVRAASLYEQACGGGNAYGCHDLATMYESGTGVTKDERRASCYYRQACDGNDHFGCARLGAMYEEGLGDQHDESHALEHYSRACEGDHMPGCLSAGLLRASSGVPGDEAIAVGYFDKACKNDYLPGCAQLCLSYAFGRGVARDEDQAFRLCDEVCRQSDMTGCSNLGELYEAGKGRPPNNAIAAKLYEQACNGSYMRGCFNLGDMYEHGKGVPLSAEKAAELYKLACAGNYRGACSAVFRLNFPP